MRWKAIILTVLTTGALVAYLIVSSAFVAVHHQDLVCAEVDIHICDSLVNSFIVPADVAVIIEKEGVKTLGERMLRMDMHQLEQLLNKRNVIKNTEAFTSIDGVLHINVYQRRPIIRVQTPQDRFYIDETGYIFPLSGVHTSFVPIVTGNVPIALPAGYRGVIPAAESFLQQVYDLALFLDEDSFWQSQVTQLNVQDAALVDMVPRVGNQLIRLGSLDNYRYKFNKLMAFYQKVCQADGPEIYAMIDLRYGNQVVGVKK